MQTLQSDFYCRMEYKNQYKEGIPLEVLKVQLHSKKKNVGSFAVPNNLVKHVGSLCWVIPMFIGLFQKTTQPVGLKFEFQRSIDVTASDDTVVN